MFKTKIVYEYIYVDRLTKYLLVSTSSIKDRVAIYSPLFKNIITRNYKIMSDSSI